MDAMEFEPIIPLQVNGTPTISPNPPIAGQTVTLTPNVLAPGGLPLTVGWNFGDGATGSGESTTHAWAAPGSYAASLTADDGNSDPVAQDFTVKVANPLTAKGSVKLNFKASGKDAIVLKGKLQDRPDGFSAGGKAFRVDVGGASATGTLDGKGKAAQLAVKKSGGFVIKLKNGSFAAALLDEGLTNETVKKKAVTIPVLVVVGDDAFGTLRNAKYSAKQGKSGSAK
jgi:hypothetical protein